MTRIAAATISLRRATLAGRILVERTVCSGMDDPVSRPLLRASPGSGKHFSLVQAYYAVVKVNQIVIGVPEPVSAVTRGFDLTSARLEGGFPNDPISVSPRRLPSRSRGVAALSLALVADANAASSFTLFETGQVRPLAMSPDGSHLFAVNTPDDRLEIFDITGAEHRPRRARSPVGLEPLAVAARTNTEVWVVNHLSDSVSIVDVTTPATARVVRTLLVGDEPRDLVFAGPGGNRAFITTAHRGQNTPLHPTIETVLTTPGIGRADVWVFDAANLGCDARRDAAHHRHALRRHAASASPSRPTAARCTRRSSTPATVRPRSRKARPERRSRCRRAAGPEHQFRQASRSRGRSDRAATTAPSGPTSSTAIGTARSDSRCPTRTSSRSTPTPTRRSRSAGPSGFYTGVGTILFNMVDEPGEREGLRRQPRVAEPRALRRRGTSTRAASSRSASRASVRGHLAESRITVLDGASVLPRHLNKHIDYTTCCAPLPNTENDDSIAFPTRHGGLERRRHALRRRLRLERGRRLQHGPARGQHVHPVGREPARRLRRRPDRVSCSTRRATRLYVLTRFDDSISVLSTGTGVRAAARGASTIPSPRASSHGRPILYDTTFSSSHGDSACASCHIFGDFDSLAWDLGNPDDVVVNNPGPFTIRSSSIPTSTR